MNILIREETAADIPAVHDINEAAFGRDGESRLVDSLRCSGRLLLSLVAEVDGELVGHLAFSPVTVQSETKYFGVGLGPVAVLPPFQGQGIGSRLIQRGLAMLCERGERAVFVLGHAEYYPRFGFRPSKYFGIGCEFPVPEEIFMALELQTGALDNVSGIIHYAPEFHDVA